MSKADSGNRDSILEDLVNSDETSILILRNLKFPLREKDISSRTFPELESGDVKVMDYMVSQNCAHILRSLFAKYRDISASSNEDETFISILKDLNHPMREDILNMTFFELESEVVEVRDYMVSRNCAPILESLFDKDGDISASSTLNPKTKMHVLNIVGGVAQSMCDTKVKDITSNLLLNWWKNLKLAQNVGFNVQFAFDHLYGLAQAQFRMDREFRANLILYLSQMKIEKLPTILEVHKDEQKQFIRSRRKKSILEKDCLI
ncbi:uncharacterized protein LOC115987863 [Quercus lobata]|nr:uncharacterized protein LOC115987863 [Quercus lobata]